MIIVTVFLVFISHKYTFMNLTAHNVPTCEKKKKHICTDQVRYNFYLLPAAKLLATCRWNMEQVNCEFVFFFFSKQMAMGNVQCVVRCHFNIY